MGTFVWHWPQVTMAILFKYPAVRWMLLLMLLYFGGFWTEARP